MHPASQGGASGPVHAGVSVLDLYDPDRSRGCAAATRAAVARLRGSWAEPHFDDASLEAAQGLAVLICEATELAEREAP